MSSLQSVLLLQTPHLPLEAVVVVRKSFDARPKQRNFVYVVDVDAKAATAAGATPRFKQGQIERWIQLINWKAASTSTPQHPKHPC